MSNRKVNADRLAAILSELGLVLEGAEKAGAAKRGMVTVLPLAIRHWRMDHLGWSQEVLAARASRTPTAKEHGVTVSPSTVAMMERGKRQPSELVADCIAEAMGIPVGAFAIVRGKSDQVDDEQVA